VCVRLCLDCCYYYVFACRTLRVLGVSLDLEFPFIFCNDGDVVYAYVVGK